MRFLGTLQWANLMHGPFLSGYRGIPVQRVSPGQGGKSVILALGGNQVELFHGAASRATYGQRNHAWFRGRDVGSQDGFHQAVA